MSGTSVEQVKNLTLLKTVISGILAGLVGGLVFGLMMGTIGMLPTVSMLIGVENAAAGFVVHMGISAFIGAVYALVAERFPLTSKNAVFGGIINGSVWWVLAG